jgi:CRP/FNR family transcriptional regulator, nitrogen fixation regulation protein
MLIQTARHQTQTGPVGGREPRTAPPAFHALFASIELSGAPMHFDRNAEIYGEDEPADYVYKVLQGSVRAYKVLSDGRRQINAFYLPGDIFGLEVGNEHSCSAEAVSNVQVLVVKRSLVMTIADRNTDVAHRLWSMTAGELRRSQNHSLLLIKTARERVAAFLLDMAERLCTDGAVELPMSRQDIADYLGLTIETVSRTLSQFEGAATIELPASRRIVLRNRSALSRLNA